MNEMSYAGAAYEVVSLKEKLYEAEQRIAELERELAYSKGAIDAVQAEMGWSKSDALARRDKLVKAAAYEEVRDSWSGALTKVADRLRREAEVDDVLKYRV